MQAKQVSAKTCGHGSVFISLPLFGNIVSQWIIWVRCTQQCLDAASTQTKLVKVLTVLLVKDIQHFPTILRANFWLKPCKRPQGCCYICQHCTATCRPCDRHTSEGQFLFVEQDSICLSGYQGKSALACLCLDGISLLRSAPAGSR